MAIIVLNPLFVSVRGRIGDVVLKKRGDILYMSRRPDFSRRKLTESQQASVDGFRLAVEFARKVLADPIARQPYEEIARKRRRSVYNTIVSEYLKTLRIEKSAASNNLPPLSGNDGTPMEPASNDLPGQSPDRFKLKHWTRAEAFKRIGIGEETPPKEGGVGNAALVA